MDDKRYIIFDIDSGYFVAYITLEELMRIYLLREEVDLFEKYIFRDKQENQIKSI